VLCAWSRLCSTLRTTMEVSWLRTASRRERRDVQNWRRVEYFSSVCTHLRYIKFLYSSLPQLTCTCKTLSVKSGKVGKSGGWWLPNGCRLVVKLTGSSSQAHWRPLAIFIFSICLIALKQAFNLVPWSIVCCAKTCEARGVRCQ